MEAVYQNRMKDFIKEPGQEDDMIEYMLSAAPFIKEYYTERKVEDTGQKSALFKSRKIGTQRKDIYEKYMSAIENESFPVHKSIPINPCKYCDSVEFTMDSAASDEICLRCGITRYVQSDEVGFKEEQEIEKNIIYTYKRENHFNEWVAQFQAKESTNVPNEVIEQIRSEFKKQKIKDVSEITHSKVRALLKKLNMNKYYEHVPYITTILNGIKPPTMNQAMEDKLRLMFHHIQKPFEKHRPIDRKNFLSYSYVLYKFCELLGEDDYLPCFQLLKSKEKLYKQDQIWKKICHELSWEYIKTI
jgi:hypothetical protein